MDDFPEKNTNKLYMHCLLIDTPSLMPIEANKNKLYIPSSSLKGKLCSRIGELTYLSEENTDKEIVVILYSTGSGKTYCPAMLLIASYQKITRKFSSIFNDDVISENWSKTQNKFKKADFIHKDKTEKLERLNAAFQESLSLILEEVLFRLRKPQYLLLLLARIYLVKKLKVKLKLIYDLSDTLINCVFLASIPP